MILNKKFEALDKKIIQEETTSLSGRIWSSSMSDHCDLKE